VEYRSRPISVSGTVKKPITFQAIGTVTLLDTIAEAEGLADNAGAELGRDPITLNHEASFDPAVSSLSGQLQAPGKLACRWIRVILMIVR